MMIAKKALPRRTMLKALGAALPLPLLDAMVPAMTALRQTPAAAPLRFGAVYVPNGVIPSMWLPAGEGSAFEFSPTLKPLEPYRDRLMVVSGLDSLPPPPPGERQFNNHADASTRFLTDVTPSRTLRAGVSIDQIAAKSIGGDTMLPSLELALESVDSGTSCDFGRSCVYTGTISWAGPTSPLPMEHDPAAAFARLFGDGANSDAASRLASMQHKNSILDSLLGEVATLRNKVAAADRTRLANYLESVRDVERRIQRAVAHNTELPRFDRPAGVPETFADHARLMFDMQLLAYQGDVTRVVTFMVGREFSGRTYPEIGVPDAHHPISHHQRDPVRMEKCAKINHLPRLAVRGVRGEVEEHARWRRLAARPHRYRLRRWHERRKRPRPHQPSDSSRRWRKQPIEGRPVCEVRRRDTAGQLPLECVGQAGRARGEPRQ